MFGKLISKKPGDISFEYPVNQEYTYVGRSKDCDVRIENSTTSDKQFLLSAKGDGKVNIQNLSKNPPTKVNQKSISFQIDHELAEHDVISFANREFTWSYVVNKSVNQNAGEASNVVTRSNKQPRKSEPAISHRKVAIVAPHRSTDEELGPPRKRCKLSYEPEMTCGPLRGGSTSLYNPPSSSFAQRKLYDRLLKNRKNTPRNRRSLFGSRRATPNMSPWVNQSAVNCEEQQLRILNQEVSLPSYCPEAAFNNSITPNTFYKRRNTNRREPSMPQVFAFSGREPIQNYDEGAQLFTRRSNVYNSSGKRERISTPFPKKKLSSSFHSHKTPRSRATSGFYFPTIEEDGQQQGDRTQIETRKVLLPTPDEGYMGRGMTPASYFSPAPTGSPRMMRADSPSLAFNVRSGRKGRPSQNFATPNGVMPLNRDDASMGYYGWNDSMNQGPSTSFTNSSCQIQSPRTGIVETPGSTMFSSSEFDFTRSPMDYSYSNRRFVFNTPYSPSQSTQDLPLTPRSNRVAFLKSSSITSKRNNVSQRKPKSSYKKPPSELLHPSSSEGITDDGQPVRRRSLRSSKYQEEAPLNDSKVSIYNVDSKKTEEESTLNVSVKSKKSTLNKSKATTPLNKSKSKATTPLNKSKSKSNTPLNKSKSKASTPVNKSKSKTSTGVEEEKEVSLNVSTNSRSSRKKASLQQQVTPRSILKSPSNVASPLQGSTSISNISVIERSSINHHVSFSTPAAIKKKRTSKTTSTPFPNSMNLAKKLTDESTLPTDLDPSESHVSYMSSDSPDYDIASDDESTRPSDVSSQLTLVSNSLQSNATTKRRKSKNVSFVAVKTSLRRKSKGSLKRSSIDILPSTEVRENNISSSSLRNTSSRKDLSITDISKNADLKVEPFEMTMNLQPETSTSKLATPLKTSRSSSAKSATRLSSKSTTDSLPNVSVARNIKQERISPDQANLSRSNGTTSSQKKRTTIPIVKDEVTTPTNTSLKVNFRSSRKTASAKTQTVSTPLSSKKKAHSRSLNFDTNSSLKTRSQLSNNSSALRLKRKLTDEFVLRLSPEIEAPSLPKRKASSRAQLSPLGKLSAPSPLRAPQIIITKATPPPVACSRVTPQTVSPVVVLRALRNEGLDKSVSIGNVTPTSSFRQSGQRSSSAKSSKRKLETSVALSPRVSLRKLNLDPGKTDKKKMAALLMCHKKKSSLETIGKPTVRKSLGVISTPVRRPSKAIKLRTSLPMNFKTKILNISSSVGITVEGHHDSSKEQTSPGDDLLNALDLSRRTETIVDQQKPARRLRSSRKDLSASQAAASSSGVGDVIVRPPMVENNTRVSGTGEFAEKRSSTQQVMVSSPITPAEERTSYIFTPSPVKSPRRRRSSRKSATAPQSEMVTSICTDNVIFRSPLVEFDDRVSGKGQSSMERRVLGASPTTPNDEPMSRVFTTSPVVDYTDNTGKKKLFRASSSSGINCGRIKELIPAEEIDYSGVRNLFEEPSLLSSNHTSPEPPKRVTETKLKEKTIQEKPSPRKTRNARLCSEENVKMAPKTRKGTSLKTPKKVTSTIGKVSPTKGNNTSLPSPSISPKQLRRGKQAAKLKLEAMSTKKQKPNAELKGQTKSTSAKPNQIDTPSMNASPSPKKLRSEKKSTPAKSKQANVSPAKTRTRSRGAASKMEPEIVNSRNSSDGKSQLKQRSKKGKLVAPTSTRTTRKGAAANTTPEVPSVRKQRKDGEPKTTAKSTVTTKVEKVDSPSNKTTQNSSTRTMRRGAVAKLEPKVMSSPKPSVTKASNTKRPSFTAKPRKVSDIGTRTRRGIAKLKRDSTNGESRTKGPASKAIKVASPTKTAAPSTRTKSKAAEAKVEPKATRVQKSKTQETSLQPAKKSTKTLAKPSIGNKTRKTTAGKKSPPKTIGKMTLKQSRSKPSREKPSKSTAPAAQRRKSSASTKTTSTTRRNKLGASKTASK